MKFVFLLLSWALFFGCASAPAELTKTAPASNDNIKSYGEKKEAQKIDAKRRSMIGRDRL
jgi:hypothetical protein